MRAGLTPPGRTPAGLTPRGQTPAGLTPRGRTLRGQTRPGPTPAGRTPQAENEPGSIAFWRRDRSRRLERRVTHSRGGGALTQKGQPVADEPREPKDHTFWRCAPSPRLLRSESTFMRRRPPDGR